MKISLNLNNFINLIELKHWVNLNNLKTLKLYYYNSYINKYNTTG